MGRLGKAQGTILSDDPGSLVGLIGEVRTDIEPYSTAQYWLRESYAEPVVKNSFLRAVRSASSDRMRMC